VNFHALGIAFAGILFGAAMHGVGFTDYGALHRMFRFQEFRLFLVFAGAVVVTGTGYRFTPPRKPFTPRKVHRGTLPGSVLFGVGWVLSGACPIIPFIQLGEGKLAAGVTLAGIFSGAWIWRRWLQPYLKWDTGTCTE
jgi:uncharacterized membrane protein YedE/YeeE